MDGWIASLLIAGTVTSFGSLAGAITAWLRSRKHDGHKQEIVITSRSGERVAIQADELAGTDIKNVEAVLRELLAAVETVEKRESTRGDRPQAAGTGA